jgi:hypothetical protein
MDPGSSQLLAHWQPTVGPGKLPPTEAEWLQRKGSIWQMFVFNQMGQEEVLSELEKAGFSATYVLLCS